MKNSTIMSYCVICNNFRVWQNQFCFLSTLSLRAELTDLSVFPEHTSTEFEEAAELLSADPGASTLSMSASNSSTPTAAAQDVKLDLSEDEEGQEESSEVGGAFVLHRESLCPCQIGGVGVVRVGAGDNSYV